MDEMFGNNSWQTVIESCGDFNESSIVSVADTSDILSECSFNIDAFKNHENSLDILNATDEIQIEQNDENHLIEKQILNETCYIITDEKIQDNVESLEKLIPEDTEIKYNPENKNLLISPDKKVKFAHINFQSNDKCREVCKTHNKINANVHLYQNVPHPKNIHRSPTPTYVNMPVPFNRKMENYKQNSHSVDLNNKLNSSLYNRKKVNQSSPYEKKIRQPTYARNSPGYVQMNSPYVRSPVSSIHVKIASRLASFAGQAPQTLFCPLCPRQFSFERTLSSHIQKLHRIEMQVMVEGKLDDFDMQSCPICQANFFNKSVLPKHLIDCHKDTIVPLLEKHKCLQVTPRGMQCPFCVKCLPLGINGEHMLLFHLQQYHLTLYEDLINRTFENNNETVSIHQLNNISNSNTLKTPGLSNRMKTVFIANEYKRKFSELDQEGNPMGPVRKSPRTSETCLGPHRAVSKGILRSSTTPRLPKVKRELRFTVPPVTKEEFYFPESPEPQNLNSRVFQYTNGETTSTHNSSLDKSYVELENTSTSFIRKRRSLGLHVRTGRLFRCKDKENLDSKLEKSFQQPTYMSTNFRSFRRPIAKEKTIDPSKKMSTTNGSPCANKLHSINGKGSVITGSSTLKNSESLSNEGETTENNLTSLKLSSQLRLFRCNNCRNKFCDSVSLVSHVSQVHKGFMSMLRPQFGCGVCAAKFYESKHLVRHCLSHHMSLLQRGSATPVTAL